MIQGASYEDWAVYADGRREKLDEGHNLVVNTAFIAMAMLFKQDATAGGFMYMAVGDGNTTNTTSWDAGVLAGTIVPTKTETQLLRETFRKAIADTDIIFVDPTNATSVAPTNRVKITVTLDFDEPSGGGNLREWALFGGSTAAFGPTNPNPLSGAANAGLMINHKTHKTYAKTISVKLERVIYFNF